ncbi:MAG: F0F1 ATP synthase subunit B family protein [Gammaproteobacteria bacterium]
MEFNASTFILEIVNFLILVWILQRLLYRPVLDVIAKRRGEIEKTLSDARSIREEAEALQSRYENRLVHWEEEKKSAQEALNREIEEERRLLMAKLKATLEQEHQKAGVVEKRRLAELKRACEKRALRNGADFAGRLLKQAAGPELQERLFAFLLEELTELPSDCRQSIASLNQDHPVDIRVDSAMDMNPAQRHRLEKKLSSLLTVPARYGYARNGDLIAGFRITIGPWVLRANLKDELAGFAEIADETL